MKPSSRPESRAVVPEVSQCQRPLPVCGAEGDAVSVIVREEWKLGLQGRVQWLRGLMMEQQAQALWRPGAQAQRQPVPVRESPEVLTQAEAEELPQV